MTSIAWGLTLSVPQPQGLTVGDFVVSWPLLTIIATGSGAWAALWNVARGGRRLAGAAAREAGDAALAAKKADLNTSELKLEFREKMARIETRLDSVQSELDRLIRKDQ